MNNNNNYNLVNSSYELEFNSSVMMDIIDT